MQPYFFPYLGYFSLIKQTERFILIDSVQFIKQGWIERNRVLRSDEGWQYIKVPLEKHRRETKISNIRINNAEDWKERIFRLLEHYKKKSLFYNDTISVLDEALNINTNSIVELNKNCIKTVCNYLGIKNTLEIFTEMGMEIDTPSCSDEWALNICRALGNVTEYWNPEGGLGFYDKTKYLNKGVDIKFLKINLEEYPQKHEMFEPGLSIIDVMMFNSPSKINEMLDNYSIL